MEKNYTVCLLFNKNLTKTLLIKKIDGKLFGGRYNALGGKVEMGETIKQACIREIWEESENLINLTQPIHIATLTFPYDKVINLHVFYDIIEEVNIPNNREGQPQWLPVEFLLDFNNESVVGNGNLAYFCKLAITDAKNLTNAGKEALLS